MITLTTGTAFIMWIGEQITERGIGNGISLIIFAGIVVGLPRAISEIIRNLELRTWSLFQVILLLVVMVITVAAVVFVERGQRKIPVQYAKRVVGRKVYGGQATHLPLRVNSGGVIPVIFAASIVSIPSTMGAVMPNTFMKNLSTQLAQGMPLYNLLYVAGIIFFCFLLRQHNLQPDGSRRQHSQIRRVHTGNPARQEDCGIHRSHSKSVDSGRRDLPGAGMPAAGISHHRV